LFFAEPMKMSTFKRRVHDVRDPPDFAVFSSVCRWSIVIHYVEYPAQCESGRAGRFLVFLFRPLASRRGHRCTDTHLVLCRDEEEDGGSRRSRRVVKKPARFRDDDDEEVVVAKERGSTRAASKTKRKKQEKVELVEEEEEDQEEPEEEAEQKQPATRARKASKGTKAKKRKKQDEQLEEDEEGEEVWDQDDGGEYVEGAEDLLAAAERKAPRKRVRRAREERARTPPPPPRMLVRQPGEACTLLHVPVDLAPAKIASQLNATSLFSLARVSRYCRYIVEPALREHAMSTLGVPEIAALQKYLSVKDTLYVFGFFFSAKL
jgi:hypothetical protein